MEGFTWKVFDIPVYSFAVSSGMLLSGVYGEKPIILEVNRRLIFVNK